MKSGTWILLLILGLNSAEVFGQIIFSEPFNEATGSTSGNDNIGGVAWTTSCATCLAGDYFNVQTNVLECEDTNGPATWTTNNIDISVCSGNALISFTVVSALGTMEECTAGCGCNCVDWIMAEYSINGGAFASASSAAGGPCAQGCSGGNYALIGDAVAFPYAFTYCIPATGSTLVLRISMQTWAAGEKYRIDDVTVQCFNCVLPVEMVSFTAKEKDNSVELDWATASETASDYFVIERAEVNGIFFALDSIDAAGYATQPTAYHFTDGEPVSGINYYRICQIDQNGKRNYSETLPVQMSQSTIFYVSQLSDGILVNGCMENEIITITDFTGRQVHQWVATGKSSLFIQHITPGFYIAHAGNPENRRQAAFFIH
ncbi:MAG: hypothetical protein ACHQF2_08435 [Flavobacteriales bacterium]